MKSDYIFGISDWVKKNDYNVEPGRILCAYDFMLGTPCLMLSSKKDVDNSESILKPKKEVVGIVPFCPRGVRKKISSSATNRELKIGPDPSIRLLNRTDLDVVGLDLDKIPRALDFVRSQGPLTLFIDNSPSTLKELKVFITLMYEEFPITSGFRFFNNEIGRLQGKIQTAVTLTDINDVYPIYNTEKVDGVLVDIITFHEGYLKKNNNDPAHFMEMCQLFSKYPENIVEVDGQALEVSSHHVGKKDALNFLNRQSPLYK